MLGGTPAAGDDELDPIAGSIGSRLAQGAEQIGVQVGHGGNLVIEDRHIGWATVIAGVDVDQWCGLRGLGCQRLENEDT